jgi:MoaA/NifB/PqqE/SkfB family radical SAM enzyme
MALEIKRYFNYVKKNFVGDLNFLILFVTSKCNLRCDACFFHDGLNKSDDLNFSEYEKIAKSLKKTSILLLSGGEPFFNKDLTKICSSFIENSGVDSLVIPTNGTLKDDIVMAVENLLKTFPKLSLNINISIDGLAEYHDKIRGAKGTFEKAIETIKELSELKRVYPNLQTGVNSVIQKNNLEELKKLMIFLRQFDLDYHAFDILRGDPKDKSMSLPGLDEISEMHKLILKNRDWYLKRKNPRKFSILGFLERVSVLGLLRYTQITKEAVLGGGYWGMPCQAGKSIAVVYPNGDFSLCELMPPVTNLSKVDYDLGNLLKNKEIKEKVKEIKERKCDCTHVCFINSAIGARPQSAFKIFYYYLKSLPIIKKND